MSAVCWVSRDKVNAQNNFNHSVDWLLYYIAYDEDACGYGYLREAIR